MLPPPDSPFAASPHDALSSATRTVLESAGNIVAHVTSTSSSTSSPTSSSAPGPNGECELLGPFAILVQATLGLAAIMSLVFKRYRERPQRPLKIWFFDVSKQVFGSVLVHIANLLMSMLSSGQFSVMAEPVTVSAAAGSSIVQRVRRMTEPKDAYVPNPCSFYLLNLAIDTTLGIPILIFLLRLLTHLARKTPMGVPAESIESGNYGSPPRTWWWFKQSMIYFVGLMGMKFCVLIIFLALPIISRVGDWALSWTDGNEALQVVFVMLIFPVIMNATQYYIIDSFIKKQNHDEMQVLPQEDADEDDHSCDEHPVRRASEDAAVKKLDLGTQIAVTDVDAIKSPLRRGAGDYDPLRDGESSPLVLASSEPIDEPKDLIGENSNSAESDR